MKNTLKSIIKYEKCKMFLVGIESTTYCDNGYVVRFYDLYIIGISGNHFVIWTR